MATTSAPIPAPTKVGALYDTADRLKDEALALFSEFESDSSVSDLIEMANELGARAYRFASAVQSVNEGLLQL